jgi:uncharacterized protein
MNNERAGPSRRRFLVAGGTIVAGASTVVTANAFWRAPSQVEVFRAEVTVPGLPSALDGLTIAQVTDLHLYDGIHLAARRTIELLAAERPDLVVHTGDLSEKVSQLPEVSALLRECRPPLGQFATLGNWEHQVGITPGLMATACSAGGTDFLYNESRLIRRGGATLALLGLDDPYSGMADPAFALREVPPGTAALWAFHAPQFADDVPASLPAPVLMLAGHTHGGQIRLPGFRPVVPPGAGRFVDGWYRDTRGPLYVSRGIGTTFIRARLNCPPELPVFTLRRG